MFCFDAYTVQPDDWGEYGVKFGNKGDNYRVEGKNECDDDDNGDDDDNHCPPQPTKTPVPTNTLVPTNTDVPTATNTQVPPTNTSVPTNTPIPTNTGAPTNTPVATNTAGPTNTLVIPTNTPKATQTAGSPTATPTATNTLPPVIVVIEPTAPPSSPLAPFCEMNAVNATEDKRVEIAFTWRNAAAIVGTWGDGEPITGIPNQEAGFAVISHQYAADRQFAQILILAGKGAEKHLCTVNIVFDQQSAATAAPICGDSCEGSQADNQTQSQSQSQEINIGLFSGDSPDSGAAWLWCLVGLLAFFALLAFTAVIASALRR